MYLQHLLFQTFGYLKQQIPVMLNSNLLMVTLNSNFISQVLKIAEELIESST